jgi:hypothetical protein
MDCGVRLVARLARLNLIRDILARRVRVDADYIAFHASRRRYVSALPHRQHAHMPLI